MENNSAAMSYKGKPLIRSGNEIYYGEPAASHILYLEILAEGEVDGIATANRVRVQLLKNNPEQPTASRVVKESEKNGIYSALDIGGIWLERALSENK